MSADKSNVPVGIALFAASLLIGKTKSRWLLKNDKLSHEPKTLTIWHRHSNDDISYSFVQTSIDSPEFFLRVNLLGWSDVENLDLIYHLDTNSYEVKGKFQYDDVKHPNCYCDSCVLAADRSVVNQFSPIAGTRYRCLSCNDFDACGKCYQAHVSSSINPSASICGHDGHKFCSIYRPIMEPGEVLASSYSDCLVNMLLNGGDLPAIGHVSAQKPGAFQWLSFRDIYSQAMQCGSSMRELGLQAQDFVLICAENSLDYIIMVIACGIYGFTTVPISPTATMDDVEGITAQIPHECFLLVCSMTTFPMIHAMLMDKVRRFLPSLRDVVALGGDVEHTSTSNLTPCRSLSVHPFQALLTKGYCAHNAGSKESHYQAPQWVPSTALVTIAFTSGTSQGSPKGIPFTGQDLLHQIKSWAQSYYTIPVPREIGFVFTSLSYAANMETVSWLLFVGGQAGIFTQPVEGMAELTRQLELLRPTYIAAPPVFWTELYNQYCVDKAKIVAQDIDTLKQHSTLKELDNRYGTMFGDRLIRVSTGSAYTPEPVFRFMKYVISSADSKRVCMVNEGYGAMECGSIATNGRFVMGVEWRLLPVEGYTDTPEFLYGELLVKTKEMSSGYYNNEMMSQERYTSDGYFKTGDLVSLRCKCRDFPASSVGAASDSGLSLDDDIPPCRCDKLGGRLVKVIGRTGVMVKLSDGEMFNPEKVEGFLLECPSILQIFVHVEISWAFPCAVVVVEASLLSSGVEHAESVIFSEMSDLVDRGIVLGKHLPLAFLLTDQRFTVQSGLLTVSSKTCRIKLKKRYFNELMDRYSAMQAIRTEKTIQNLLTPILSISGSADDTFQVDKTTNIWKAGLSSLSAVALASSMSTSMHIPKSVSLNLVMQSDSVESLSDRVKSWVKTGSVSEDWRDQVESDLMWLPHVDKLNYNLTASFRSNAKSSWSCRKTVLLTGSTGFLGSVILAELLLRSPERINVVVIARTVSRSDCATYCSAQDRVISQLAQHVDEVVMSTILQSEHFQCLEGDICQPMFGLSGAAYAGLVDDVDIVVHCAAETSWVSSYAQLRGSNVIATQNVIQLIIDGKANRKPKYLCHISTLSASFSGEGAGVTAHENASSYIKNAREYVDNLISGSAQGYSMTKMVAESLVRKCAEKFDFRFCVVRPGTISAHSVTGFSNMTDFTTRLIRSLKTLGTTMWPTLEHDGGSVDLACVDFVAEEIRSIVMMALEIRNGTTVQICNHRRTSFAAIISAVKASLQPDVTPVSAVQWARHLAQDSADPLHVLADSLGSILHKSPSPPSSLNPSDISGKQPVTDGKYHVKDCPSYDPAVMVPLTLQWLDERQSQLSGHSSVDV
eukprot:CAMPEP_0114433426 /NCGR_PEP_ID=MMETSP0103-20121206/11688_1 /TAXON_ID=37642 ORGANISM="Paraphysomonas imperforata, Strain PA2" /NCGR_SAMPLE_ID=MMETSP0103 /ASSEMBLY_ACC=CAM_ASM_000201 /LENGTH=1345 /DNA_ID=CAMNT_0001603179 /DNA_START=55 /DNA_END=4092 /DNA_ORIENTATION=-